MRSLLISAATMLFLTAQPAAAGVFSLDGRYAQHDGAILSYPNVKTLIDPYFPTKALIIAQDAGLDTAALAHGWIGWLMARQEENGLFSRYCLKDGSTQYSSCLVADADDAMMALWIELLYRTAPDSGMPKEWKQSVDKAQARLDELYDHKTNVYVISKALPVGLLMDNMEIYSSLKRAGAEARRLGDLRTSASLHAKAVRLREGIMDTFWNAGDERFVASTQTREKLEFYPDHLAQLMPMLHGFRSARTGTHESVYSAWMQTHKPEWMALIGKDYPWGLVAVAATGRNDFATADCWVQQVAAHRHSGTWDIVDEAAYQAAETNLRKAGASAACEGTLS